MMYEVGIDSLHLNLSSGKHYEFPDTLANGRANYILFEELVRALTGLVKTNQSDHVGPDGKKYEQKAYKDAQLHPGAREDLFQTSASSTFGANNFGPEIKRLLAAGKYQDALDICAQTGYAKNDFYIYTNTRGFEPSIPFRYFVVPTNLVLENLDQSDPRLISRATLISYVTGTKVIDS